MRTVVRCGAVEAAGGGWRRAWAAGGKIATVVFVIQLASKIMGRISWCGTL